MNEQPFVGKCRVPMWMYGTPAGHCDNDAYGNQLPEAVLFETRSFRDPPFCHGPCCAFHGGPRKGEPIIFRDGYTNDGYPMWCAVMPGFVNLQESDAEFSANPLIARKAILAKSKAPDHD